MADTRVYAALLRAGMAGQATYRASFAVELFGTAIGMGLDFVEIFAVFESGLAAEAGVDRVLTVELTEPAGPLGDVPGTRLLSVEAGGLRQHLALTGSAAAAVAAVSARTELRDLTIAEPDIEDVVARLYRRAAAARSSTVVG